MFTKKRGGVTQNKKTSVVDKNLTDYEVFKKKVYAKLRSHKYGLTWHEIRDKAKLQQTVPNNRWTKQLERDIGLQRVKDARGMVWVLVQCQ